MASIPGSVRFAGFIAPTDSTDTFPVFKPIYGLGGLRTVASITERNAITTQRREEGMIVYVTADTIYYKLESGLTNSDWTVFNSGSGSGSFLPLSGGTVTGNALFSSSLSANNFNATVITGGTFISGSTNLYNIFAPLGVTSGSYNQPGSNISTGGTANNQIISLVASPQINNLYASGITSGTSIIGNALSGGTIYSGSSDLSTVFMPINATFVTGNGTANYLPLWLGAGSLTVSSLYEDPITGISIFNNVEISGDLTVLGTAYTTNTSIIQSFDNLIILNYSGNHLSSTGGGLMVQSGQTSGSPSLWIIDSFGNWSANTQIIAGGGINVESGTTLSSGGTDLYSIFATISQSGGTSASLWSASTGTNSIRANNGTTNEAGGYTSIVAGQSNNAGGDYSSIIGGSNNIISNSGTHALISGGLSNKAIGSKSIIVGGRENTGSTFYSIVIGGIQNLSLGEKSFVGNGSLNKALNDYSTVLNGSDNIASGDRSFISNGSSNSAITQSSSVIGGSNNLASGQVSIVNGGTYNIASGDYSSVAGYRNIASGNYSVISGGGFNKATNSYSTIAGGNNNQANGNYAFIGGGNLNTAQTNSSSILGGQNNITFGNNSSIIGGISNNIDVNSHYSSVIGGQYNRVNATHSSILNGSGNTLSGNRSAIIGGQNISGSSNDTVYLPNARLAETLGSVIYSAGTPLEQIFNINGSTSYAITLTGISASTTYTITHNLNTTDIVPALWDESTGDLIYARLTNRLTNTVDVIFTASPGANVRIVIKK